MPGTALYTYAVHPSIEEDKTHPPAWGCDGGGCCSSAGGSSPSSAFITGLEARR
jgi:hypothetical protein